MNTAAHDHESTDNGFRIFATVPFAQDPTGGVLPDDLPGQNSTPIGNPFESDEHTIALYHFNNSWEDASPHEHDLTPTAGVQFSAEAPAWMWERSGAAAYFPSATEQLTVNISDDLVMSSESAQLTIEWMQLIDGIVVQNPAETNAPGEQYVYFEQGYDTKFRVFTSKWSEPYGPSFDVSGVEVGSHDQTYKFIHDGFSTMWNSFRIIFEPGGNTKTYINGRLIAEAPAPPNYGRDADWELILGGFVGWIDEFRISNTVRADRLGSDPLGQGYEPYVEWKADKFPDVPPSEPELTEPTGNVDADETSNLFEFLARTNPSDGNSSVIPGGELKEIESEAMLEFSYRRPKGGSQATNTLYTVGELSCHLETASMLTGEGVWSEAPEQWTVLEDRTDHLDGTETVTCRTQIDTAVALFARLRLVYTPQQP